MLRQAGIGRSRSGMFGSGTAGLAGFVEVRCVQVCMAWRGQVWQVWLGTKTNKALESENVKSN